MKRYAILLLTFVCSFFSYAQNNNYNNYYYHKGEKKYLDIDYSRISAVSKNDVANKTLRNGSSEYKISKQISLQKKATTISLKKANYIEDITVFAKDIELNEKVNSDEYFESINNLRKDETYLHVSPGYIYKGKKIGVTNNFYVKLFDSKDIDVLYELADKYSIEILGYNKFMPLWITLSCLTPSTYNAVEAANIFYETGLFAATEPGFILYYPAFNSRPNDPLYHMQWGMNNTGQHEGITDIDIEAEKAWEITKGLNVSIAVVDNGIQQDHPDIKTNITLGFDTYTGEEGAAIYGSHGTMCAGVIAAENNNIGISGVAPNAKLIPISIKERITTIGESMIMAQDFADGINWAWINGAEVISNSWGLEGLSLSTIDDAIESALSKGRNGKGCIVVFSAGNQTFWDYPYNDPISYPANINSDILVVGAATPKGKRKDYYDYFNGNSENEAINSFWASRYGSVLDVVAPGIFIPTTNINSTYIDYFGQTSAACPHVAGIAALVLHVNPDLTVKEVNDIIERSAQKTGGYVYNNLSSRLNGGWNEEMGYGFVNAYEAVKLAQKSKEKCVVLGYTIVDPIKSSVDYATVESLTPEFKPIIEASSKISENIFVNFISSKVKLTHGFKVNPGTGGRFIAKIGHCSEVNMRSTETLTNINNKTSYSMPIKTVIESKESSTIVSLTPNPTTGILYFNCSDYNAEGIIKIYSITGALVYTNTAIKNGDSIDLNSCAKGMYLAKIEVNGKIITEKIMLK